MLHQDIDILGMHSEERAISPTGNFDDLLEVRFEERKDDGDFERASNSTGFDMQWKPKEEMQ